MTNTIEKNKLNEKLKELAMRLAENEPFDEVEVYTNAKIELLIQNDEIVLTFDGQKVRVINSYEDIAEFVEKMEDVLYENNFEEKAVEFIEHFDYELYAFLHFRNGEFGILISNVDSQEDAEEKEEIQHFFVGFDFEEAIKFAKEKYNL